MISILKQPYECSFTKNPVTFEVQTNMQYLTERVHPYMIIKVNTIPLAGEFCQFQFINPETNDPEVVRLAVNTTNTFPGALPSVWAGTTAEYAAEIVARLKLMYPINAFFNFWSIGKSVWIQATQPIEDLSFTNLITNQSTLHLEMNNFPLWNNPDPREGYTMQAIVYFEKQYLSGNFESVATCTIVPDAESVSLLDIADILDAETEAGWNELPMPGNAVSKAECVRRYYVELLEYWDDDPVSKKVQSSILHSHWGGVSTNDELMIEPIAYIQANNQWLSWWPSGKKLYYEQPDWLSWMNTGIDATFQIILVLYKNTGEIEDTIGSITLKRWESVTIPVGHKQLNLDAYLSPGEGFQKWGIIIRQGVKDLTPGLLYYRHSGQCINHHILYWNSFGMPETFMTNGEWKESTEITKLMAKRAMQFNEYRLKPGVFVFDSKHQNSITTETARISKLEGERMQSMFNTTMAMLWKDKRWIPAIVTTDKTPVLIESEFTTELKVELLLANVNDRASFYGVSPKLVPIIECGIVGFKLDTNGVVVDDYSSLLITLNGSTVQTATWDDLTGQYTCATVITSNGIYDALVTIHDEDGIPYPLSVSVPFTRKRIYATYPQTGVPGFYITSSEETASIWVDFGVGTGFEVKPYIDTATFIGKTVSITGKKQLILEKPCFDDIIQLQCADMHLTGMEFHLFKNLQELALNDSGISGIIYLNALTKLEGITLESLDITGLEIGIMPNLSSIMIGYCPLFGNDAIDSLVTQLWDMRKHFLAPINVYVAGSGLTWSVDAQARLDGTGIYAGEGMVTDYSFVFNID